LTYQISDLMSKIIFITGATSGIGKAAADIFAKYGHDIIITGRRKEKLLQLSQILKEKYKIDVLALNFDIRKRAEVKKAVNSLEGKWRKIDVLLNNAGLAVGFDKIQEGNSDDWDTMIDTNIKGLLNVSHEIIPLFIENRKGHVINIGSTAGKVVYERGNVYSATKYAVDAISKSMRIDLLSEGIKVTQVSPGAVETEFALVRFKGDQDKAKNVYKGFKPLTANDVAQNIYYLTTLPDHVCINELEITALAQANSTYFYKE